MMTVTMFWDLGSAVRSQRHAAGDHVQASVSRNLSNWSSCRIRWCKKSSLAMGQKVVQNSRNVLGERSHILRTKVGMGSGISINRQSGREREFMVDSGSMHMSKIELSPEELKTVKVSRLPMMFNCTQTRHFCTPAHLLPLFSDLSDSLDHSPNAFALAQGVP